MSNTLQQDPLATLIEAINTATGTQLNKADVFFSTPQRVTNHPSSRNTFVLVVPFTYTGVYGRLRVYYNRIHASALAPLQVERVSETRVWDILPRINTMKGLAMTTADVLDAALPPKPEGGGKVTLDLQFNPNSYIFYGGTGDDDQEASPLPAQPPADGTQIDSACHDVALVGTLADGAGGFTEIVLDAQSTFCGYEVPFDGQQFVFQDPPNDEPDFVFDEPTNP